MTEKRENSACLINMQCVPCQGGVEPLQPQEIKEYMKQLSSDWHVIDNKNLEKEYRFKNFIEALEFVNRVGQLAESLGHHPDIYLSWGKVKLTIWTHKIGGLHKNDFILAAMADEL